MTTRRRWPGPTKRERPARERIREPREPLCADPMNDVYAMEAETARREKVDRKLQDARRKMEAAERKGEGPGNTLLGVLYGAAVVAALAWWIA